jgi:alkanesulfonate monooxygenase SsuD/methylene tetrahydromethanopterin reductase-like flavin-dependent oxidoreductase (luciferase family)/putative NADH-flavin reductase
VVHAAIARATSHITLTTTATVLSVLDPVRVYQDFATLDLVSHGRAEIIAGRSAFAEPFALFGEDIAQVDDLFAEKPDLLLRLRDEDRVTWFGRFRPPLQDAAPNPQPVGSLPIWVAVGGTPASAQRAGRLGLPMALGLIGGTIDHAKRLVDLHRTAGRDAGHPDEQLTVGITSHFYVGESQEQALHDFYPYYHRYLSPETNGGRGFYVDHNAMARLAARRGALMVGGPAQVAEKILDLHAELGVDRFLGQVDLGGMPHQMVRDSIQRFGDIVARPPPRPHQGAGTPTRINVTVFGATGAIGSLTVNEFLANGHTVTAYARNPTKIPTAWGNRIRVIIGELSDADAIDRAVQGADAVVSALGPSLDRKATELPLVDGTRHILDAMKRHGVTRYIGHGTPSILDPREKPTWQTKLVGFMGRTGLPRAYQELIGMTELIMNAGVDWTIVRFTAPKDTPKTGKLRVGFFGIDRIVFAVSRADIAAFTAAQVDDDSYINRAPAISN